METVQNKTGLHIQNQIRQNAEELKNTLNDLYSWEKEMKDKEQKLKLSKDSTDTTSYPIRSQPPAMPQLGTKKTQVSQTANTIIEPQEEEERRRQLAEVFKERGNKQVKLGEYKTAVDHYTAAIETYDKDPKFYTNRALCYIKLEKYDECIEDCNRAIEIDNLSVKAYYRRMQANEYLGFNTKALQDCTTVLMIDSKNSDAKTSLERINQRLKKTGAVPKGYSASDSAIDGPHFSPLRGNTIDILPANKPSYARSKKPLKNIPIIDVIGPKDGKNFENSNIQISDEVIDKLFNGECGSYEEVKKAPVEENVRTRKEILDSNKISTAEVAPKPAKQTKLEAELSLTTKDRILPPPPTSTAQFYCNWKELSGIHKYQYIKSIEVPQLNKILGAGFDSDTLSDLLVTFKEFYISNKDNVCETLLEMSKHDRLPILSLLLSSEDTTALSQILDYIHKSNGGSTENINIIKKSFNLE